MVLEHPIWISEDFDPHEISKDLWRDWSYYWRWIWKSGIDCYTHYWELQWTHKNIPYYFYFDHFFNRVPLLAELCKESIMQAGLSGVTNWIKDALCLVWQHWMRRNEEVSHPFFGKVNANEVKITRWQGNGLIIVPSLVHGQNLLWKVKRW